jgi:hypothetical protein
VQGENVLLIFIFICIFSSGFVVLADKVVTWWCEMRREQRWEKYRDDLEHLG